MSPLNKAGNDPAVHDIVKALSDADLSDFVRGIQTGTPSSTIKFEADGLGNQWIIVEFNRSQHPPVRLQILTVADGVWIYAVTANRQVLVARSRTTDSALDVIQAYLSKDGAPNTSLL